MSSIRTSFAPTCELRRTLAIILFTIRTAEAVIGAWCMLQAHVFSLAPTSQIVLGAVTRVAAQLVHARSIVQTELRLVRATLVHVVLTLAAVPLLRARACRLSVRQPLARAVVLTRQCQTQVVLAPLASVAIAALTRRFGIVHVEVRALQDARPVVTTGSQSTETGMIERYGAIRADVIVRAITKIAVDEIGTVASVGARRRGALVDVRLATRRTREQVHITALLHEN